jgi:hypothetical protein
MENVNQCQFTAHVKVSVCGAKLSGELKQYTPCSKLTLLYSGHPAAYRLFILVHLAMYSELHLPVGYIIPLSQSHSSCQGSLRSAR